MPVLSFLLDVDDFTDAIQEIENSNSNVMQAVKYGVQDDSY